MWESIPPSQVRPEIVDFHSERRCDRQEGRVIEIEEQRIQERYNIARKQWAELDVGASRVM